MLRSEIAGWKVGQTFDQTARRTEIGKLICRCTSTYKAKRVS